MAVNFHNKKFYNIGLRCHLGQTWYGDEVPGPAKDLVSDDLGAGAIFHLHLGDLSVEAFSQKHDTCQKFWRKVGMGPFENETFVGCMGAKFGSTAFGCVRELKRNMPGDVYPTGRQADKYTYIIQRQRDA
jgi:hypothetical protein